MGEIDQIVPRGPFSLQAAAEFGFGPNEGAAPAFDGTMRLAFPRDDGRGYAGAMLRQPGGLGGPVEIALELRGETGPKARSAAVAQAARIVSLDHDGEAFAAVGERDAVLGALQRAHPGQRPVLFCSPYEAAAWSVLSARRPARQGAQVRAALGAELGETFELAGQTVSAFPLPERLAQIPDGYPGLNATKVGRLREVAAAALSGGLEMAHIHELGPTAAFEELQRIAGIGPFYASLIVLRASGFADAWLATGIHRGATHTARFYGIAGELTPEQLAELAEGWRPFRTWALVLMRVAGERGTRL